MLKVSLLRPWQKIAAVVVVVVIAVGAATRSDEEVPGTSTPWRASAESFDVYLTELGEFDAQHSAALASQLPGNKARIISLVPGGTLVQPGDVIAEFDTSSFQEEQARLSADLAEAHIQVAKTNTEYELKQEELKAMSQDLRNRLELAELAHTKLQQVDFPLRRQTAALELEELRTQQSHAERKRTTMVKLYDRGYASNDELGVTRDLEHKAREKVAAAQTRLRLLEEVEIPGELRQSELQLAHARMELQEFDLFAEQQLQLKEAARQRAKYAAKRLQRRQLQIEGYLENSVITSPVAGFVNYPQMTFGKDLRRVQVGDAVWRAQPFVIIPDLDSLITKIQVREVEVGDLAVGQSVQVSPSAFQDLRFSGTVMSVGTLVDAETGSAERRFEVRIALNRSDPRLRPGMTAHVRVHTHHYERTLLVPVEAVYFDNQHSFTYVSQGRGWEKRALELGGNDGRYVAVTAGLREGDAVAYSASSEWLVDD